MNGGSTHKKQSPWHTSWIAPPLHFKYYKALIDSRAEISLLCDSTYQRIDGSFKTPIQSTTAKLNTTNGSPMTALGMTALHLRIADFKFTHDRFSR